LRKLRPAKAHSALRRRWFDYQLPRTELHETSGLVEFVELASEQVDEESFSIRQAAIATSDGPLLIQITHDPRSKSVSSAGLYDSNDFVELPGRTLPSLAAELGDARIDLLKLDIEGGEHDVLRTLDLQALGVKVLAAQLHHNGSVAQARAFHRSTAS
jgi:FkbM family methyltransferase